MIKFEIEGHHKSREVSFGFECSGSVQELFADAATLIHLVHGIILNDSELAASKFRELLAEVVNDPNDETWDPVDWGNP